MNTLKLALSFGLLAPVAFVPATMPTAVAQTAPPTIRIVPCDQPVKSAKRGVCINKMDAADFMALSPSVSWYYNWYYDDTQHAPKDAHMEFLPMAWGARDDDLNGLKAYLEKNHPSHILALNEPNLKGQAFITPEQSADFYKKVKTLADTYKIPVVGPHMALGSANNDSITAMDPVENKQVTYTFMVPFVKAFMHYMGDADVSAVAAHTYGNSGELTWMTGMMNKEFNRPVWVTEFAQWNAPSADAERDYMIQSVDLFERTPYVQGYAWFKERVDKNDKISLLDKESGKLTPLGETYVHMPVHDENVYYQLPGRLQAECYVRMDGAKIAATEDTDGFLEMRADGDQNWLEYNVAVPQAKPYTVKARFKADQGTKVDILAGDTVLATVQAQANGWQDATATLKLPAGNQTLRVHPQGNARLNWMEFSLAP